MQPATDVKELSSCLARESKHQVLRKWCFGNITLGKSDCRRCVCHPYIIAHRETDLCNPLIKKEVPNLLEKDREASWNESWASKLHFGKSKLRPRKFGRAGCKLTSAFLSEEQPHSQGNFYRRELVLFELKFETNINHFPHFQKTTSFFCHWIHKRVRNRENIIRNTFES